MKIEHVIQYLEDLAPLSYSEDFDNTGLLTGTSNQDLTGILVTLDTTEEVITEAIKKGCNMVVSFHPIIFLGLKKINGNNYVERVVIKAIKYDIAIYAIHTALDNAYRGVNHTICEVLGLINRKILIPKKNALKKLMVYVPKKYEASIKEVLFQSGAGAIGNYDKCSFSTEGQGTFRGNENSMPKAGNRGEFVTEQETLISVLYEVHNESKIITSMTEAHPYEEVAYDIISISNTHSHLGMGMIGELPEDMDEKEFLRLVKNRMYAAGIRHSKFLNKPIRRVAVLGGSGAFAIQSAKQNGADIFITADVKYHQFYQAEHDFIIADIGHYESEQFIKTHIVDYLTKKITNFAVVLSSINTNPVNYL